MTNVFRDHKSGVRMTESHDDVERINKIVGQKMTATKPKKNYNTCETLK